MTDPPFSQNTGNLGPVPFVFKTRRFVSPLPGPREGGHCNRFGGKTMFQKSSSLPRRLAALLLCCLLMAQFIPAALAGDPPALTVDAVNRPTDSDSAEIFFTSGADGAYFYTVTNAGAAAPEIDTSGEGTPCAAGTQAALTLTGLGLDAKDVYLQLTDEKGTAVGDPVCVNLPDAHAFTLTVRAKGSTALEKPYAECAPGGTLTLELCASARTDSGAKLGRISGAIRSPEGFPLSEDLPWDAPAVDTDGDNIPDSQPEQGPGEFYKVWDETPLDVGVGGTALFTFSLTVPEDTPEGTYYWVDLNSVELEHPSGAAQSFRVEPLTLGARTVCTVIWLNGDGTQLDRKTYYKGTDEPVTDKVPVKAPDEEYIYTFESWDEGVLDDAGTVKTYTPAFTSAPRAAYTVIWLDGDGTELDWKTYKEGEAEPTTDKVPTKAADADNTYVFAGWDNGTVEGNVKTYKPTFTAVPKTEYTVIWLDGDGTELDRKTYKEGQDEPTTDKVPTKAADADNTYVFVGWDNGTVEGNVRIYKPTFSAVPKTEYIEKWNNPFVDVDESCIDYESILNVCGAGLFKGVSENEFAPDAPMTRAMIVTVLHRMEGEPFTDYSGVFNDVPFGEWYTDGIEWAASCGIVLGYGNGMFGTQDNVTREQLVTILHRYADYKGYGLFSDYVYIIDADMISDYAIEPVFWAAWNGMLRIEDNNHIRPKDEATRSELARAIDVFLTFITP